MLRFTIHDEKGETGDWPLRHVSLLDQEDLVVPGKVRFQDGVIECQTSGRRALGLRLLYDTGACGRMVLQTCLLPDRVKPYHLSVELARHRIAIFLAKSEEWQMLDLSDQHPAMLRWEEARQHLTSALVADDPAVAEQSARKAITLGIDASERLAMAHAEILLHRRFQSRSTSSATFGIRLNVQKQSQSLADLIQSQFDLLVMPLQWSRLVPRKGVYDWKHCDRWMAWAQDNHVKVVVGPLIDLNEDGLPGWVVKGGLDYSRISDLAYEHVSQVLGRYGDVIGMYNIASGINTNVLCEFSRKQMVNLVRTLAVLVRQGRRGRRVMLELSKPWGEYLSTSDGALSPFVFLEQLMHEGIRLDAIGVRLLVGDGRSGMGARDMMEISRMLDRFFLLELPVVLSNVGVPSEQVEEQGGWWHEPWSPSQQSLWLSRLYPLALSKPYVESIFWSDLYDHEETLPPKSGLVNEAGKPKPVLQKLLGIRNRLSKPLGPLKLPRRSASEVE